MGLSQSSSLRQKFAAEAKAQGLVPRAGAVRDVALQVAASPAGVAARESAVSSITDAVAAKLQAYHIPVSRGILARGVADMMEAIIPVAATFGLAVVPTLTRVLSATGIPGVTQVAVVAGTIVDAIGAPVTAFIISQNQEVAEYLRTKYGENAATVDNSGRLNIDPAVEAQMKQHAAIEGAGVGGYAPIWSTGNYLAGRCGGDYSSYMHKTAGVLPIAVDAGAVGGDDNISVLSHPHYGAASGGDDVVGLLTQPHVSAHGGDDAVSVLSHPHYGAASGGDDAVGLLTQPHISAHGGDDAISVLSHPHFAGGKHRRHGANHPADLFKRGGKHGGAGDAPTIAIAELAKYTDSINAKTKDQIVDDIIRAMASLGFKASGTDRLSKIKSIIDALPSGDKFKTADESHRRVCGSIARVLNDVYGTQIIDPDLAPELVCRQVLEIVRSLAAGMHTEFLSVYAEAKTVLNNMHLLNLATDENLSQVRDAVAAENDVNLTNRVAYNFQVYDMLRGERDRQLTLMKNLLNVDLLPTERDITTLLKSIDETTAAHIEKLDWKSGQSEFGKLIAASLKGLTLTAALGEMINNALKRVGMTVADYVATTDPGKFLDKMADLYLKRGQMSDKESEEVRAAIKLLYKNFYRNTDIGAMLSKKLAPGAHTGGVGGGDDGACAHCGSMGACSCSRSEGKCQCAGDCLCGRAANGGDNIDGGSCGRCGADGPCMCSSSHGGCGCSGDCVCGRVGARAGGRSGGAHRYPKSTVDKRVRNLRATRNLIFNAFYRRLRELFGQVVASLDIISKKVGSEIPLSDNLDSFRHIIQRLREGLIENRGIYYALIGYYNDALSKQKRETLLGELKMISSNVDAILEMDLYRASAQYFRDFQNGIKAIVELIDKYSGELAAKLGRGQDEACQYLDEQDEKRMQAVAGGGECSCEGPCVCGRAGGYSWDANGTLGGASGGDFWGSDKEPFDLPVEIKRTSRTIYDAFRQFDYYYRSAQIRQNLAASSKELGQYAEKYEALTAASIAKVLQEAHDRYEATREFLECLKLEDDKNFDVATRDNQLFTDGESARTEREAALKFLKQQWEARKRFWATVEAIDTYMRVFTDGIVKDPMSVRKIEAMLEDVEVLNDTYTNETGEKLAAVFEKFPAAITGVSNAVASPLKNNTEFDRHYYTKIAREGGVLGNPYIVALPSDGLAARMLARDVVSGLGMLKNFMSIFIFIGSKFGGQELRNKVFMTPTQIYNNIVEYIQASAFCQGFGQCSENEFRRDGSRDNSRLLVPESWTKYSGKLRLGLPLNIKNMRDALRGTSGENDLTFRKRTARIGVENLQPFDVCMRNLADNLRKLQRDINMSIDEINVESVKPAQASIQAAQAAIDELQGEVDSTTNLSEFNLMAIKNISDSVNKVVSLINAPAGTPVAATVKDVKDTLEQIEENVKAAMEEHGVSGSYTGGDLGSAIVGLVRKLIGKRDDSAVTFYSNDDRNRSTGATRSKLVCGVALNDWMPADHSAKLNFKRLFGVWMRSVIPDLQQFELCGFENEDLHFVMMMKSLAAKILTVTGTYDVFDRPHEINSISPIRMILGGRRRGGADVVPKVEEGAVELYLRLPLLAQFYRDLFGYDSDAYYTDLGDIPRKEAINLKISMIPEVEGLFAGLIKFIFRRTKDVYETAYSDDEIRALIAEINTIYQRQHAAHGANVISETIRGFIDEVNRRYAIVTKHDHDQYERYFGEPYDYKYSEGSEASAAYDRYDQVPPEDVALLPNEGEPEISRMSPAERLLSSTRVRTKDPLVGHKLVNGYHKLLYRFRCCIDRIFDDSDSSGEFTFKNSIRSAMARLRAESSDVARLRIVASLIRGVDVYSKIDGMRYLMFHETVVAGLNSLSAMHTMLQSFRDLALVLNLHKLEELTFKYIESVAGQKPSLDDLIKFIEKYFREKALVEMPNLSTVLGQIFGSDSNATVRGGTGAGGYVVKHVDGITRDIDRRNVSINARRYDGKSQLSGFNARSYKEGDILLTTGANLDVGARSASASGLWGILAGFSTRELCEARTERKSTPARKAALTFFRYLFDREYVMRLLVETLYGICGDASGAADFRIEDAHLHVNVGGFKRQIEELFANVSYFIDAFRPFLPQEFMDRYLMKVNPGSYYWLHEQLVERLLVGRPAQRYEQGSIKERPEYITIDKAALGLSGAYDILTLKYECDGSGLDDNVESQLNAATGVNMFTRYDKVFAEMIFYNSALPGSGLAPGAGDDAKSLSGDGIADSPVSYVDFKNDPYDALHISGHGAQRLLDTRFIARFKQLYTWDGEFTFNRSVLFVFNQLIAKYIKQCYDPATAKLYINTINAFANGSFNQAVLDFKYTYPDTVPALYCDMKDVNNPNPLSKAPFEGAMRAKEKSATQVAIGAKDEPILVLAVTDRLGMAGEALERFDLASLKSPISVPTGAVDKANKNFGSRMDPDGQHVLFSSLSDILRNLLSVKNPVNGQLVYIAESVSDVPLYMKEKFRASLPLFALLLKHLSARCAHLQKFVSRPEICLDRTNWNDAAGGAPNGNPWPYVLVKPQSDSETTRNRFNGILEAVMKGCTSLISGCEQVLREVGDLDPKYFELNAGSIRDYKMQNGIDPFMPLSSTLRIFRNGYDDECCDALPVYALGDDHFKFQYGTRQLLAMPHSAVTLEHVPGYAHIVDSYNSLIESRNQLDKKRGGEFLQVLVRALRFIFEMRQIRGLLTPFVVDDLGSLNGSIQAGDRSIHAMGLFSRTDMVIASDRYNVIYQIDPGMITNRPEAPASLVLSNIARDVLQKPVKVAYAIEKPLASVISLTESALRDEKIREVIKYISDSDRDMRSLVVQNIVDMNVIPINVHALMREIPLVNLYNYAYTFDRMIIELYYGLQNANARKMIAELCLDQDSREGVSASALKNVKSAKDMMVALLIRPYMFTGNREYGELAKDMLLGVSGNELGRPKFLSDQLYGKCLFGELYEGRDTYSEAGPPAGHVAACAVSREDLLLALSNIGVNTFVQSTGVNRPADKDPLRRMFYDLTRLCMEVPIDRYVGDIVKQLVDRNVPAKYLGNNWDANIYITYYTDKMDALVAMTIICKCLAACSDILSRGPFRKDLIGAFDRTYYEIVINFLDNINRITPPAADEDYRKLVEKHLKGKYGQLYKSIFDGKRVPAGDKIPSAVAEIHRQSIGSVIVGDARNDGNMPLRNERITLHYLDECERCDDDYGATIQPDNENVVDNEQIHAVAISGDATFLVALGKLRCNTKFVRNLIFVVNLYRSIRLKLQRDLVYNRDVILKSAAITRPSLTEFAGNSIYKKRKRYGHAPARGQYDSDHKYEQYGRS